MITSLFAALLGLFYIYVSIFVIRRRRSVQAAVGTGNDKVLERRIAAHENFQNYVPLFLLLLFLVEHQAPWRAPVLAGFGTLFLLGRFLHFYSLNFAELRPKPEFRWRIAGMMITFLCLAALSLWNLYLFFFMRFFH